MGGLGGDPQFDPYLLEQKVTKKPGREYPSDQITQQTGREMRIVRTDIQGHRQVGSGPCHAYLKGWKGLVL